MDDNGSSIIIAGLLCFLLTGFLCCGESPRAPVSVADPPGVGALGPGRAHQRRSRPAKAKLPAPAPQEGGGSDTRANSGGCAKV